MKRLAEILFLTLMQLACMAALSKASELVINGGAAGSISVQFTSATNAISILLPQSTEQWSAPLHSTHMACVLHVSKDGAVQSITFQGEGRCDVDFIARSVEASSGVTNIENPSVVLDGVTNDIVSAWQALARTDRRFSITRED